MWLKKWHNLSTQTLMQIYRAVSYTFGIWTRRSPGSAPGVLVCSYCVCLSLPRSVRHVQAHLREDQTLDVLIAAHIEQQEEEEEEGTYENQQRWARQRLQREGSCSSKDAGSCTANPSNVFWTGRCTETSFTSRYVKRTVFHPFHYNFLLLNSECYQWTLKEALFKEDDLCRSAFPFGWLLSRGFRLGFLVVGNVELQAEKTRLQFEANRDVVRSVLSWFYGFSLVLLLAFVASQQTSANEMVFVIKWRERERERVLSWSFAWLQQNLETIDRLLFEGEARLAKFQHPDPYIGTHSQTFLLFYHLFWCWRVGS
jgi:hypothetical protein